MKRIRRCHHWCAATDVAVFDAPSSATPYYMIGFNLGFDALVELYR